MSAPASDWRDTEQEQALYHLIADDFARDPGLRPEEDVLVALSPNDRADWSFGHGLATYVKDHAA